MVSDEDTQERSYKGALAYLSKLQREDGLWPYTEKHDGALEPSCWAAIALRSDRACLNRFLNQLLKLQNKDGGWSNDSARLSSDWTTGIALMTLRILQSNANILAIDLDHESSEIDQAIKHATDWLIDNRCQKYGPSARFALLLWKGPEYDYDRGWPWTQDTFDWVEPTAYALLALRKLRFSEDEKFKRIISLAESYLLKLCCPQGGWNCGDRSPIGTVIPADMQFSALALLALATKQTTPEVLKSIKLLQDRKMESRAECAWAGLALRRFDKLTSNLRQQIIGGQNSEGSLSTAILTHSVACLALERGNIINLL